MLVPNFPRRKTVGSSAPPEVHRSLREIRRALIVAVLCGGVLKHQWQVEMFRTRLEEGDALSRELRGSLAEAEGRAAQDKVP